MTDDELDTEAEQERLDGLGQRIAQTRHDVDEHDPTTEDERAYVDSGADPEDDDQTASPM